MGRLGIWARLGRPSLRQRWWRTVSRRSWPHSRSFRRRGGFSRRRGPFVPCRCPCWRGETCCKSCHTACGGSARLGSERWRGRSPRRRRARRRCSQVKLVNAASGGRAYRLCRFAFGFRHIKRAVVPIATNRRWNQAALNSNPFSIPRLMNQGFLAFASRGCKPKPAEFIQGQFADGKLTPDTWLPMALAFHGGTRCERRNSDLPGNSSLARIWSIPESQAVSDQGSGRIDVASSHYLVSAG